MIKVVGEGNILVDIKFRNKITRIQLTQDMHVPGADGKILSLKMLDQKGFETRISGGHICIMKADETYAEASLGNELYKVKMKIILPQCNGHERRPRRPKKLEVWGPIVQRGLNIIQLTKSVKRTPSRIPHAMHLRSRFRKPILKLN